MLHEIMATPPAAQAGQDGSLDMATRVPLGTTGIVVTQRVVSLLVLVVVSVIFFKTP